MSFIRIKSFIVALDTIAYIYKHGEQCIGIKFKDKNIAEIVAMFDSEEKRDATFDLICEKIFS